MVCERWWWIRWMGCAVFLAASGGCKDDASRRELDGSIEDDRVSAVGALTGACMREQADGGASCSGVDEYAECALAECGLQDCLEGACDATLACLSAAPDRCDNACLRNATEACQACLGSSGMCAVDECLPLLTCGDVTDDGPCDQLDACCEALDGAMRDACEVAASSARVSGDDACESALSGLCASDAGATPDSDGGDEANQE